MTKALKYSQHALGCRHLAKQMTGSEQREQLLKMAETWDVLARERERTLRIGQTPASLSVAGEDPKRN
jgi:hypothetical protein